MSAFHLIKVAMRGLTSALVTMKVSPTTALRRKLRYDMQSSASAMQVIAEALTNYRNSRDENAPLDGGVVSFQDDA